jgi:hypothetical protein
MENDHERWLMRVLAAAERAAEQIDAIGSPFHRGLQTDLVQLQERLRAELDALERDTS